MIFEIVDFYANVKVDEDVLGNPVYEELVIGSYPATITQWSTEEIALLERTVTKSQRKLLTHAPVDVLKQASHIYINGVKYAEIDVKSDFRRWRLCHVKEYKL